VFRRPSLEDDDQHFRVVESKAELFLRPFLVANLDRYFRHIADRDRNRTTNAVFSRLPLKTLLDLCQDARLHGRAINNPVVHIRAVNGMRLR
jgi:hypothetical protein